MDTLIRHMKTILTVFPFIVALLLSGCGSGCGTLGVENTSPCVNGSSTGNSDNPITPSTFTIFGTVSGGVLQGVTINLTGAATGSTTTDANGRYSFTALPTGSYTVVPSVAGTTFNPVSSAVTISGANVTASNFQGTANTAVTSSISGTISGAVAQNVLITLSGGNNGSAVTDSQGNYSFSGLAAGSYTVTPSLVGHTFSPTSHFVTTISGGTAAGINFTEAATP